MTAMSYASFALSDLIACPFCRELYQSGEAKVCPTCGLDLQPMSKLPPSYEAKLEDDWPEKPEWETLPLHYWRRGRGPLLAAGLAGAVLFFVPWVSVQAPEFVSLSGFEIARTLGWVWGCLVAWITLTAVVASRRCVAKMRGARVAAALFSAIPLVTTVVLALTPPGGGLVPVRFTYSPGFYATLVLALVALPFAFRFGGRIDDLPLMKGKSEGETLH